MSSLAACIRAESVKLRKSWSLLAAILSPICLVGFIAVMFWYSDAVVVRFRPGSRFWLDLNIVGWNLFVLPVLAAVISDMSWAQDRDASAWRYLLPLPVSRAKQYLAKLVNLAVLVIFSQILLFLLVLLVRLVLLKNEALRMGPMEMALFCEFALFSIIASIPVVAFQTWFSFRFPGAGIALGIALVGTWAAMKIIGLTVLIQFLPWGLSCHAITIFDRYKKVPWQYFPWSYCFGAMALTLLFVVVGSFDFKKNAVTKSLEKN